MESIFDILYNLLSGIFGDSKEREDDDFTH